MQRGRVSPMKGNVYENAEDGQHYELIEFLSNLQDACVRNINSSETVVIPISNLKNIQSKEYNAVDLSEITDKQLNQAKEKYEVIKPILFGDELGNPVTVDMQVKKTGVAQRTIYNWLKAYDRTSSIQGLIQLKPGWVGGKSRLTPQQEAVIEEVLNNFYLTEQKPILEKVYREISRRCYKENLPKPSRNAINRRIKQISEKTLLEKRGQRKKASDTQTAKPGEYPQVDFPLQVIQIDHTKIDVMVVDNQNRQSIGRAWLTLGIDVYSRMVTGYYLSLDAPSATSVAMCVARGILPKTSLLAEFDIDAEWLVFGYPNKIHVDNGKDFHSKAFKTACEIHQIALEFRPVKVPHYGTHIERLMGTFMEEVHTLPGTTFSNIYQRGEYDSEKNAVLTLDELEKWLLTYITQVYHKRLHTTLGKSPEAQWHMGIYGDGINYGMGIPTFPQDSKALLIDFLPGEERTVQHTGVTYDGLRYYAPCLNNFINKKDDKGNTQKFIFKRDPRDISKLHFYDPILKEYFDVPFSNPRLPAISIWEYREVRKMIKDRGDEFVNEQQIYDGIEKMRAIVEESTEKSKKARRVAQRNKSHSKVKQHIENTIVKHSDASEISDNKVSQTPVKSSKFTTLSDGLIEDINFDVDDLDID